jgi:hypothetical protein
MNYQSIIEKWECLNCGETRNITMVPVRISNYINIYDTEEEYEDILIYRPKYTLTYELLKNGEKGECYCSYRCFNNPKKLRSKL